MVLESEIDGIDNVTQPLTWSSLFEQHGMQNSHGYIGFLAFHVGDYCQ